MDIKLPDLQRHRLDKTIKSTTFAILHMNHGRDALRFHDSLRALDKYGLALMYLVGCSGPMASHLWNQAMQGFEAAMLCAFFIEDLRAFGSEYRDCMLNLKGKDADHAAVELQKLIMCYAKAGTRE